MDRPDVFFDVIGKAIESEQPLDKIKNTLTEQFGETCAVLALDSTGFTRITQAFGAPHFLSLIYLLRKVCRKIFKINNAIDWRSHADSVFAEFKTIDEAVQAAFAVHLYFEKHPIPLMGDDDLFGGCVGIGYGPVLRSEHEGVYGHEMNLASKLGEDTARRGETLLTKAAFQALSNKDHFNVIERQVHASGVEIEVFQLQPTK